MFVEIIKSTRTSNASILDHLLSTFVFVAFLVEFLLVRGAATSVFFTLMVITLIDVLAGFSVSLRAAGPRRHRQLIRRGLAFGGEAGGLDTGDGRRLVIVRRIA